MEYLTRLLPESLLARFSERARSALLRLLDAASRRRRTLLTPFDLLTVLTSQRGGVAAQLLRSHRFVLAPEAPHQDTGRPVSEPRLVRPSPALAEVFRRAVGAAAKFSQPFIGTEHLLLGILEVAAEDQDLRAKLPASFVETLSRHLATLLSSSQKVFELIASQSQHPTSAPGTSPATHATPALTAFGQNLTAQAEGERLDPVIGREEELERITAILIRRTKNNPLLVGDPGVGKTALVMGLAQRIAAGRVPTQLAGRNVWMLDMGLLVAGSIYRGEFEARLKEIIHEVRESHTILFIDEFHTVIGAGSAPGSLDAANILKPALALGEIQMIGATTYQEYRRYVEHDQALERRLQPVFVAEPSRRATLAILAGLKPRLERHHGVTIPAKTLEAAVRLSPLYLPQRFFPDRAIDLLDEAASELRVREAERNPHVLQRQELVRVLERNEGEKRDLVERHRYDEALVRQGTTERLTKELRALADRHVKPTLVLAEDALERFVARQRGIPLERLSRESRPNLALLRRFLSTHLIGQAAVVRTLIASLRHTQSGLSQRRLGPRASFLCIGPKGVGKTLSARLLAEALTSDEAQLKDRFVKLDMAEYGEPHTVSRLLGAPPGYVGFEEGGMLTERVRRHPACLILFDEIERAHPKMQELLLGILEDGVLTDGQGRKVDFAESIIMLTANIETPNAGERKAIGFDLAPTRQEDQPPPGAKLRAHLARFFRPELVDRIERVLVFRPLTKNHIARIVRLRARTWSKALKASGVRLAIEPRVLAWLGARAFTPREGARRVRETFETLLEEPFTQHLETTSAPPPVALKAVLRRNRVVFEPAQRTHR